MAAQVAARNGFSNLVPAGAAQGLGHFANHEAIAAGKAIQHRPGGEEKTLAAGRAAVVNLVSVVVFQVRVVDAVERAGLNSDRQHRLHPL